MENRTDHPEVVAPPLVIYFVPLVAGLLLHWAFPVNLVPAPIPLFLGLPVIAVGIAFLAWAVRTMIRAGTNPEIHKPTEKIVVDGPFRFSRNPIYLSFVIIYLGITVSANALWPILLLPIAIIVVQLGVIDREERYLEQKFGAEYLQYKARVRRWI